ncbi:hypothetical protein MKW92_002565, partial [Papaver armeniacum]
PIPIKRFLLCPRDLRFDDFHGHESLENAAVVTTDNVTLDEKPVTMLEPVNGLICFVKGGNAVMEHCSVLVYNPSIRDKAPWIDTLTNAAFRKLFGVKLVKGCRRDRLKSSYEYMFGFGVDSVANKHKVFCIIEITVTRRIEEIVSRELVCGVFTVGENTWRKIEVPPETTIKKSSVHVCGSIYWISGKKPRCENGVIMAFDLASETFRSITIPNLILDHWSSIERVQLVHELAEVDGHLALLVREGDDILNLWIHTIDTGGSVTNGNWTEETLQLPCRWDKLHNLAFKAITGTSLVLLKFLKQERYAHQFRCEVLQYYDRSQKKFYKNSFEILLDPTGTPGATYSITPFFETLLPV